VDEEREMVHFDSPLVFVPGDLVATAQGLGIVVGWERRGSDSYRVSVELVG
jgi:hypothetical protein